MEQQIKKAEWSILIEKKMMYITKQILKDDMHVCYIFYVHICVCKKL